MIKQFCDWLSATALCGLISNHYWVIPTVQTVHIVSIGVVVSSMAMLHFRLLGLAGRSQSIAAVAGRFLPWTWGAVVVLLCSGALLIIGEPSRELTSAVFWLKMELVLCALLLTGAFQAVLSRGHGFWERHRVFAGAVAVVSLGLWASIVVAGRWIAYMAHG
ncbi:MAG TPA: DUF6644 family protein [Steroidobacteraceae bacterium]|nr:DUF6644 family protein [Steroidobacteraceae bacterium]